MKEQMHPLLVFDPPQGHQHGEEELGPSSQTGPPPRFVQVWRFPLGISPTSARCLPPLPWATQHFSTAPLYPLYPLPRHETLGCSRPGRDGRPCRGALGCWPAPPSPAGGRGNPGGWASGNEQGSGQPPPPTTHYQPKKCSKKVLKMSIFGKNNQGIIRKFWPSIWLVARQRNPEFSRSLTVSRWEEGGSDPPSLLGGFGPLKASRASLGG